MRGSEPGKDKRVKMSQAEETACAKAWRLQSELGGLWGTHIS